MHLTYDDGPDPVGTPRLLDVLGAYGIPATFFVIAPRAAAHPHLIERMLSEGHSVQLHCHDHVRHSALSEAAVIADTERAMGILRALRVGPTRWRTPWGDTAPFTSALAARLGLKLTGWTHDTHDWRGDAAEAMLALALPALAPGTVILAHDGLGPGALRSDVEATIAFTRGLAAAAPPGTRFEPLS